MPHHAFHFVGGCESQPLIVFASDTRASLAAACARSHRVIILAFKQKVPELTSSNGDPASIPNPDTSLLTSLGWSDRWKPYLSDYQSGQPARVLRHDGSAVVVGTESGTSRSNLRPSSPRLAVGDWVVLDGDAILDVLPRSSLLQRRDPTTGGSQPIAANVDVVGIVCGLDRPVNPARIQRFTTLAWDAGASPLVILSKTDTVETTEKDEREILAVDPTADIVAVSSVTADGVAELLKRCQDRTLVLVGESGAGKSTLLNALAGRELGATGRVRSGDSKGRHTTTARQLFVLEGNCCLIDTPGVREVGLYTDVETIDHGFRDIAELALGCRFDDCGHVGEPGCAVAQAVTDGRLGDERLQAWDKLRREAAWLERRMDPAAENRAGKALKKTIRAALKAKRPKS